MILSFSIAYMRPYIEAGIRQANGENVGDARVKRQTIRGNLLPKGRGPRAKAMLEVAKGAGWTHPYDTHLWWRSRTAERACLGVVPGAGRIYPVTMRRSGVHPLNAGLSTFRMNGPEGWHAGAKCLLWHSDDREDHPLHSVAYADGFDSVEAFRDYFVPNVGDVFEGALFRW